MQIRFTKMHGAGNDFVVLDETAGPLGLSAAQYRWLADRHFGVGADQILSVRAAPHAGVDFEYVIHNASGERVDQCGNGARCMVVFAREQGLTAQDAIRIESAGRVMQPRLMPDGRVQVDMGAPVFELPAVPFDAAGLDPRAEGGWQTWPLALGTHAQDPIVPVAVLSMGNPHAVTLVHGVDTAPVADWGPRIEHHPRFPERVNAGFLQVVDRSHAKLRVHERGAGETLACGSGACAAAVAGMRLGHFDATVHIETRGGLLTLQWAGGDADPVLLTGPATTVFTGQIDVPDVPDHP